MSDLADTDAPDIGTPTGSALAAALQAAELAHDRAELLPGLDTARRAWRLAETLAPAGQAQARAGYLVAHALYRLGRFHELGEHGATAALLLRELGQAEAACHVLRWVALGVSEIACFAEALHAAQLGLKIAEGAAHDPSRVLLTNALAACFERMGDPWQAERLLGDALALATERCGDEERFVCMNNLCAVSLTRYYLLRDGGDETEARVALEQARTWGQDAELLALRLGDPFYSTYVEANLGDALGFLGEHEAAEARFGSALRRAQARRFVTLIWRVQCSLGELAVERGRMGAARDLLQPLIAIMGDRAPQTTLMRAQGALYRALRALGDTEGALQVFERFHRAERQRSVAQLQAQATHLVTRLEVEQSRREARAHQERANALEEVAIRDPLTSLVNRRGCERHLRAALRGAGALAGTTVAMVDIDHFKIVNDAHGHAAGDAVLVHLARLLREHGRPQDLLGRLGGEEFLIAWSDTGTAQAVEIAERLRQAVAARDWGDVAPGLRVTVSIGVAPLLPRPQARTLGELLSDADQALYRAKREGRNRVARA